jgi:acyl dehydratase
MTTDLPALIADLSVGESSRTTGRTISEGEFMLLHNLMGAMTPLHVNKHYMQSHPFGERILGGGVIIGLLAAGWAVSDLYRVLVSDYGVRWTAALGIEGRFEKPFFPGDTLYVVHRIDAVRVSASRPGQAIMTVGMRGENQHGDACCVGTLRAMFDRPGLEGPGPDGAGLEVQGLERAAE